MASSPIWFQIPEWYGIQQQKDGTLLPVGTAYDARNMETGDGNLSVAKGFEKLLATPLPETDRIVKVIKPQGTDRTYVVTKNKIWLWRYYEDDDVYQWYAIGHFGQSPIPDEAQIDVLQTRIADKEYVILTRGGKGRMILLDLNADSSPFYRAFGSGLYSYEGTISAYDPDTKTITLSSAMDDEAKRRALAYGVIYGDGYFANVYDVDNDLQHITLETVLVSPPEVGASITIRGGASNEKVQYIELYANRLFATGNPDAPNRLYWSCVPGDGRTIEDWVSVDGSIDASGGFVEVGDGSADPVIGLTALSNQLLIWKRYTVWRLYGDRPSNFTLERIDRDSDLMSNAGVVTKYDAPYLLMPSGIHTYNNVSVVPVDGGVRPLRRFFDELQPYVGNSRAAFCNNRIYMTCRIGDTDSGYDNAIIVFDVARNSYMIRDGFEIADMVAVGQDIFFINGNRYIYKFESGSDYDGTPITAYWSTQPMDFGRKMNRHQALAMYTHLTGDGMNVKVYGDYLDANRQVVPLTVRSGYTTVRFRTDQSYYVQFRFENINGGAFTLHGGVNIKVLSELKE